MSVVLAPTAVLPAATLLAAALPVIDIDRDDIVVRQSCRLRATATFVIDANGDGVVHVIGDGVEILFEGALRGAAPGTAPDEYQGTGLRVTGHDVTIRGANIGGYKCGVRATGADGLLIAGGDLSDNFRQRLRSDAAAEDVRDWLWPHANDADEWLVSYGAAVYVEDATNVTIRSLRVRNGQNGIILDRVDESALYDNDCSYLSGWGLALWRSNSNVISRNALDFCVRGYSHGAYNRGQDSAGLLMFEQCCNNVVVENSITHGGDGLFLFAGREALGEVPPLDTEIDDAWYDRRGGNGNVFARNDFSFCVAHGAEFTFSFENVFHENLFEGNGICGLWGGYSQDTVIAGNTFIANGSMPSGQERGAINIEHGTGNLIQANALRDNACGVHLWWDDDKGLLETIWARRNERGSTGNTIVGNTFARDAIAVQLRATQETRMAGNAFEDVGIAIDTDDPDAIEELDEAPPPPPPPSYEAVGRRCPVGARARRGRAHIVMTDWGPHDGLTPALRFLRREDGAHVYELLGAAVELPDEAVAVEPPARLRREGALLRVTAPQPEVATPYELVVRLVDDPPLRRHGVVAAPRWVVTAFAWTTDPREDAAAWRAEAEGASASTTTRRDLSLVYGNGGPSELGLGEGLPADRFGTIATTTINLPRGRWKLVTRSDDGLRVRLDGALVVDDWTWHGPTTHEHVFEIDEQRGIDLRVEHFELDGYAVLEVALERAK